MGYHTGTCNSIASFRSAIESALTTDGWISSSGILTHSGKAVRFTEEASRLNAFFGTGQTGSSIDNESTHGVSFAMYAAGTLPIVYPAQYHIYVFANEVFIGLRYNVQPTREHWQWMSFGIAAGFPVGEGHYLTGPTSTYRAAYTTMAQQSIGLGSDDISTTAQSTSTTSANNPIRPPFINGSNTLIRASFGGSLAWFNPVLTNGAGKFYSGSMLSSRVVYYTPGQHLLTPMLGPIAFGRIEDVGSTVKLRGQLERARYVRTDYHAPGATMTIGSDTWVVFPLAMRDITTSEAYRVGLAIKV